MQAERLALDEHVVRPQVGVHEDARKPRQLRRRARAASGPSVGERPPHQLGGRPGPARPLRLARNGLGPAGDALDQGQLLLPRERAGQSTGAACGRCSPSRATPTGGPTVKRPRSRGACAATVPPRGRRGPEPVLVELERPLVARDAGELQRPARQRRAGREEQQHAAAERVAPAAEDREERRAGHLGLDRCRCLEQRRHRPVPRRHDDRLAHEADGDSRPPPAAALAGRLRLRPRHTASASFPRSSSDSGASRSGTTIHVRAAKPCLRRTPPRACPSRMSPCGATAAASRASADGATTRSAPSPSTSSTCACSRPSRQPSRSPRTRAVRGSRGSRNSGRIRGRPTG